VVQDLLSPVSTGIADSEMGPFQSLSCVSLHPDDISFKISFIARCWWLMSIIIAIWKTDQKDGGLRPAQANSS
jgi:hypothetical protein